SHFVPLKQCNEMIEYQSLLQYADYYRSISDLMSQMELHISEIPLCVQSFVTTVMTMLQDYRCELHKSACKCAGKDVMELADGMTHMFGWLEHLWHDIIQPLFLTKSNTLPLPLSLSRSFVQSDVLLSHLYQLLLCDNMLQNDNSRCFTRTLFWNCLQPYLHVFEEWITSGILRDPFHEFFVQANVNVNVNVNGNGKPNAKSSANANAHTVLQEHFTTNATDIDSIDMTNHVESKVQEWTDYVVIHAKIPSFLQSVADRICVAGKSLLIVKLLQHQLPLVCLFCLFRGQTCNGSNTLKSLSIPTLKDRLSQHIALGKVVSVHDQPNIKSVAPATPVLMTICLVSKLIVIAFLWQLSKCSCGKVQVPPSAMSIKQK
ncbi:hypothetical protein RFI_14314, partial [Reticulomyxa filosa]